MKQHEIVWYESDDGKMFTDQDSCMEHEAKQLYADSGVRFYTMDWKPVPFETESDWTYNNADYVVIDRSKENKKFVDFMYDYFGWCLLKEAFDYMKGDTFVMEWNKVKPVSSHLVY